MFLFYRVSLVLVLSLVLAHSRHENLFSIDSTDFLNAPSDDASPLWNSDEITPDSTGLTLNSLDQGVNFMSDTESNGNSNDLFASSSMDLIALPSCEAEGSLTDGILKARDGESCQPRESIGSPTDLFQDLRDSLSAPTKERNNQAGQGDPKDENRNVIFGISGFMEDEELCPTEIFGPSNIPVCRNPFTGRMVEEAGSYAVTLYNVLQYTPECVKFSMLFCCAILTSRGFLPEEAIDPSRFTPEQLEFLSGLGLLAYDARHCYWKDLVLMINIPLDVIEGD